MVHGSSCGSFASSLAGLLAAAAAAAAGTAAEEEEEEEEEDDDDGNGGNGDGDSDGDGGLSEPEPESELAERGAASAAALARLASATLSGYVNNADMTGRESGRSTREEKAEVRQFSRPSVGSCVQFSIYSLTFDMGCSGIYRQCSRGGN